MTPAPSSEQEQKDDGLEGALKRLRKYREQGAAARHPVCVNVGLYVSHMDALLAELARLQSVEGGYLWLCENIQDITYQSDKHRWRFLPRHAAETFYFYPSVDALVKAERARTE